MDASVLNISLHNKTAEGRAGWRHAERDDGPDESGEWSGVADEDRPTICAPRSFLPSRHNPSLHFILVMLLLLAIAVVSLMVCI
ncbi:hypothetical protein CH63R_14453 [Colletotrichum higginsianum IMI 349063]|uniref:Uncharacterized protein n=1 Tax=Colletotrichum higginsianum (strain IMI 349063) TaxID=759273 RepID=A0A1B7XQV6_COLHI|nr:hypothetical protein CH63R_14453 [Colletotrichum higginsianum IMI 349063]OBR02152.1 hypothetical protein CH63R_14453 [Colletotrichum higginsianum IMI 349063]